MKYVDTYSEIVYIRFALGVTYATRAHVVCAFPPAPLQQIRDTNTRRQPRVRKRRMKNDGRQFIRVD